MGADDNQAEQSEPTLLPFEPDRRRLQMRRTAKHSCAHAHVKLDTQARTVVCESCDKTLDAFYYLTLLAEEWEHRAYRDDAAKKAYAALKQESANARAKGCIYQKPKDGAGLRAWATFERYLGHEPFSIYRQGQAWYLHEEDGMRIHEDYAAMCVRHKEMEGEDG